MEGMGLKFTPVMGRHRLAHLSILGLWLALLGLIASPNSPNEEFNLPPTSHPPLHLPHPLLSAHPLYCAIIDITVVLKQADILLSII